MIISTICKSQMVLVYDITEPNTLVELPIKQIIGDLFIDWGDGSNNKNDSFGGLRNHSYKNIGKKTIIIQGSFRVYGDDHYAESNSNLVSVEKWNIDSLKSLNYAFYNCKKLVKVPVDLPKNVTDLSNVFSNALKFNFNIGSWNTENVTNMRGMFENAISFNQDIGRWKTTNVTDMSSMFVFDSIFNQNIGKWDVSNVIYMEDMFYMARKFNQDISDWQTQNVTNMKNLFLGCIAFNHNIGNWNVGNVTDFSGMFEGAIEFNQNLSKWNTSSAKFMNRMFYSSKKFNQNVSTWNTSNLVSIEKMFEDAVNFNQPINDWNTSNVVNMSDAFFNTINFKQDLSKWNIEKVNRFNKFESFMAHVTLCSKDYDKILISWSNQNVQPNLEVSFGNSKYSKKAEEARNILIAKGWIISDGGLDSTGTNACN